MIVMDVEFMICVLKKNYWMLMTTLRFELKSEMEWL